MVDATQSRISTLAAKIQTHTNKIDAYHNSHNIPGPSLDSDVPSDHVYPPDIESSRAAVLDATQELTELLQGPRQLIMTQLNNQEIVYHQLIQDFDIASRVEAAGEVSYAELASRTGIDELALQRVLRYAITNRIFAEKRPGYLSHSAASQLLAQDSGMRDWVAFSLRDIVTIGAHAVDALRQFPGLHDATKTGYSLAHGGSVWDVIARDPEHVRQFAGCMRAFAKGYDFSLQHIVNGYPWAELGNAAQVVDVGGSTGETAFALTGNFPGLHVIVQDVPDTVAQAEQREGQAVEFMAHDFFTIQPVAGADVYLLRWILHDWPDEYCKRILQALIPALKSGAKVLIMDTVLPPLGTIPNISERGLRLHDVIMQSMFDAKEREIEQWRELFTGADSRFRFTAVTQPERSRLSIIELVWEP